MFTESNCLTACDARRKTGILEVVANKTALSAIFALFGGVMVTLAARQEDDAPRLTEGLATSRVDV